MSSLKNYSRDSSRDNIVKIKSASVEPLKMGRVKSTGELRATACRVTVKYSDGKTIHHHVDTLRGGIYAGYQFAQEIIFKNMQARGVA